MEARPLSKEDRGHAENIKNHAPNGVLIERLLAAEQFWREAVKNAESINYGGHGDYCWFCHAPRIEEHLEHKPDCPWNLAQTL